MRTLRAARIQDERLLPAVRTTPRARFVPAGRAAVACFDVPVAIE